MFFRSVRLWGEPHRVQITRTSSTDEGPDLATFRGGALDEGARLSYRPRGGRLLRPMYTKRQDLAVPEWDETND